MSEFELTRTDRGFMHLAFRDCNQREGRLIESSTATEWQIWLGTGDQGKLLLNQEMVKGLLPYLREFAETGSFGRRPIQRAFLDPSIMQLAETDPLLASVRHHVLQLVDDDDSGDVHALVRLLVAYSETVTEAVRQVKGLREGLQNTVFAGIENPLRKCDDG